METRRDRERAFWDDQVITLADVIREYEAGPDPNTRAMLDALEPLAGMSVLDLACGAGLTSAWLAERGADVTAVDLSPESTARTTELCNTVGAKVNVITGEVGSVASRGAPYDRVAGRYALHHLDCAAIAPLLAQNVVPGGRGAFLETMSTNPLLRFARRHLIGRLGIARYGTLDEHPLTAADLAVLRGSFGSLELRVAEMTFLRIFDRNVLRYKYRRTGRLLGAIDDFLLDRFRLGSWSFHQVVVVSRTR